MLISRVFGFIGALSLLGACLGPQPGATRQAPTSVSVTKADVIVTGPPGYCVDMDASQEKATNAFVLLASCAAISNQPLMPQPSVPALLTASIAQGTPTSTAALDRYFRTEAGATALRSSGAVDAMRLEIENGALFIYTNGTDGENWRGLLPLDNGVLITIAMQEIGNQPVTSKDRFAELGLFARRIVSANPTLTKAIKASQTN